MKIYTNYYRIDEGFWSWLGSLIKSLFTAATSNNTKKYVGKTLKYSKDNFTDEQFNYMQELLKENDPNKLLDSINEYTTNNDIFKKHGDSEKWEMCLLSMKIRLSNDENNKETVKILTERFKELSKKYPDLGEKLAKEIKTEELPSDDKLTEIYNTHKDILEEICDAKEIDLDELTTQISEHCHDHNIENAKQYYGLLLVKLGTMMSEKSEEYIKNICGE